MRRLRADDDWNFIVKLHALTETAITHHLCLFFNNPVIDDFLTRLNLSGGKTSKIHLAQSLKLTDRLDKDFILGLSQLRNRLVHNIRNIFFDLSRRVAALANKAQFAMEACSYYYDSGWPAQERELRLNEIIVNPKRYVWLTGVSVVARQAQKSFELQINRAGRHPAAVTADDSAALRKALGPPARPPRESTVSRPNPRNSSRAPGNAPPAPRRYGAISRPGRLPPRCASLSTSRADGVSLNSTSNTNRRPSRFNSSKASAHVPASTRMPSSASAAGHPPPGLPWRPAGVVPPS